MKIIKFQHKESTYGFVSPKKKCEAFVCNYCKKKFKSQSGLIKHSNTCRIRERFSLKESQTSKLAHILWSESFKNSARKKYDFKTFAEHRDYNFFIKLSSFCIEINMDDPIEYMNWCMGLVIKPQLWCSEQNYERFIKYFTIHEDPSNAVVRSIRYIFNTTQKDVSTFFSTVKPGIILNMLEMGRISPWIIIISKDVNWNPIRLFNDEQLAKYNKIVDIKIWNILIKKQGNGILKLKELLK